MPSAAADVPVLKASLDRLATVHLGKDRRCAWRTPPKRARVDPGHSSPALRLCPPPSWADGMTLGRLIAVTHVPRESAISLFSRTAWANGVDATGFGTDMSIPFRRIAAGDPDALDAFADLVGIDGDTVSAWSPTPAGDRFALFRGGRIRVTRIEATHGRACPHCLLADVAKGPGHPRTRLALRGHWRLPDVTSCLIHGHPIVPLPIERNWWRPLDPAFQLDGLLSSIRGGAFHRPTRDPTPFEIWHDARLESGPGEAWLDSQDVHAASTFCFLLGAAIQGLKRRGAPDTASTEYLPVREDGFAIAREGPDAVRAALGHLQDRGDRMNGWFADRLPTLYHHLARTHAREAAFQPFRDLVADHVLETWPLGPEDEIFGRRVGRRRIHSVVTAARDTGIDQPRLRAMLTTLGIVRPHDEGQPDAWELFDADGAAPHLAEIGGLVTAAAFREAWGLSEHALYGFVEEKLLAPRLQGRGFHPLWALDDGRLLLEELLRDAAPATCGIAGWGAMNDVARDTNIEMARIVTAIQAGALDVRRDDTRQGFTAILVRPDEVVAKVRRSPSSITLEEFARRVGISTPGQARRLVEAGHTPFTPRRSVRGDRVRPDFTEEDICAFEERFVTCRRIADRMGIPWQTAAKLLRERGVVPFSPDGGDYGLLYLRSKVEAVERQANRSTESLDGGAATEPR